MNRRSVLLALVVGVGLVFALFLLFGRGGAHHANGSTSPSAPTARPGATAAKPATAVPQDLANERIYARRLTPVVDRSLKVFDAAVGSAAANNSLGDLGNSCSDSIKKVGILSDQVEGVPHPYPWYTPAGYLHHNVVGVYHDMVEAAVACQTDAGNNDSGASRTAVSDMVAADHHLHSMAKRLHDLARQPV